MSKGHWSQVKALMANTQTAAAGNRILPQSPKKGISWTHSQEDVSNYDKIYWSKNKSLLQGARMSPPQPGGLALTHGERFQPMRHYTRTQPVKLRRAKTHGCRTLRLLSPLLHPLPRLDGAGPALYLGICCCQACMVATQSSKTSEPQAFVKL